MISVNELRETVRRLTLEALVRPLVAEAMADGWTQEEVIAAVQAEVERFPGEAARQ